MAWSEKRHSEADDVLSELEQMLGTPRDTTVVQRSSLEKSTPSPPDTVWQPKEAVPKESKQPLRPTAWLDGLKGFAALLVYSLHHEGWVHWGVNGDFSLETGFGVAGNYHFIALPGIRLLFTGGHYGLVIFFAISGYVLASSPLRLIHEGETPRLAKSVGSALFRRWTRLFLPVAAVTFLWMTSWHLFGIEASVNPKPEKTYIDDCWRWYYDFKNYSFIFTGDPQNLYSQHTWSIPKEFQGSIVVYTSLLAFAEFGMHKRLLCEAGLVIYFMYIVDGWHCALFSMGVLFCDLDMLAARNQLPTTFRYFRRHQKWLAYVALVISLYLGGIPSETSDINDLRAAPGWYYLSFLKPQAVLDFRWFYRFWAALLAMYAIPRLPWLKSIFETAFLQYMGRICFGFYLVHGPLLWSVGDRLYAATGSVRDQHVARMPEWINAFPFPSWGPFGLEMNYLVVHLIMFPLTLVVAEAVTTLFDEPSVKISQWLFNCEVGPGVVERRKKWAP